MTANSRSLVARAIRSLEFRLANWLQRQLLPDQEMVLPCNGYELLVSSPRRSVIGRSIYLYRCWEPEVTTLLARQVRDGMTVLDIGAHIGYFTVLLSKCVGPHGRVCAFEPGAEAFRALCNNLNLNRCGNVESFAFALLDADGKVNLAQDKIEPGQERVGIFERVEGKVFDTWKTDRQLKRVDLIKLDVEGAELSVLAGMRQTLVEDRPTIIVEIHPDQLSRFSHSAEGLVDFLQTLGYSIQPVDQREITFSNGNITVVCTAKAGEEWLR